MVTFGLVIGRVRARVGLTQADLGRRVGKSQSWVSRVERGTLVTLKVANADAVCRALGATLVFAVEAPIITGADRQRDAAHARCVAFVAGRLERSGWLVEREVQIGDPRRPGWIDLLAFHPIARTLLIIEIKTRFDDMGGLERQLGWYKEHAVAVARRRGWLPLRAMTAALFLATEENDQAIRDNAQSVRQRFPARWRDLAVVVSGEATVTTNGWAIAMIDPRSRASAWCRPTVLDGRRSAARYRDATDFLARPARLRACGGF
jgi:transcriptional regulator with XRE-family HTH domain